MALADAVEAVALVLDGQQVEVLGLDARNTYPHESDSAAVTVTVHLDSAADVDHAGDLLDLGGDPVVSGGLYYRAGHRHLGVYLSLYGPANPTAGKAAA